jgi:hypothetical protein
MIIDDTWRPFDTAPKDRPILAYHENIGMVVVRYSDDYGFAFPWAAPFWRYPQTAFSHWLPLPDKPPSSKDVGVAP